MPTNADNMKTVTSTTVVELISSSLVDQDTFFSSDFTSLKNLTILFAIVFSAKVAGLEGVEPPSRGFGVHCSSQLELQASASI